MIDMMKKPPASVEGDNIASGDVHCLRKCVRFAYALFAEFLLVLHFALLFFLTVPVGRRTSFVRILRFIVTTSCASAEAGQTRTRRFKRFYLNSKPS
jgi:hypothetical protein